MAWRIVDATGLAPVPTLVRIATGRDAADIAWASAGGGLRLDDVEVTAATTAEAGMGVYGYGTVNTVPFVLFRSLAVPWLPIPFQPRGLPMSVQIERFSS